MTTTSSGAQSEPVSAGRTLERNRPPDGAHGASRNPAPELVDEPPGEPVCCAACGHVLTTTATRIEVGGAHSHTFMNPDAIVFTIGCFSAAPGCRDVGAPSTEWSWFEGAAWRTTLCARCAVQVGWSFARQPYSFVGLILSRVRH